MMRSIAVTQKKRGRGRPATGHDPTLTIRLPKELTARIDDHAKSKGETRSDVMRRFLEAGLAAESVALAAAPKRRGKGRSTETNHDCPQGHPAATHHTPPPRGGDGR